MTRSESKRAMLSELGAVPVVADAIDPDQVAQAVGNARPDVIVHELTAIPAAVDTRHMERDFAPTNPLRTEGTDYLLSAGQAVGVRRFVAQSHIAAYARGGAAVKREEDPVDTSPPRQLRANVVGMRHLEEAVLGARWTEGIVLRYGWFYGPGTSMAPGEESFELVRRLAQQLGAEKPMRVPRFIGRLAAGEAGVVMMNEIRGASNAKSKRELGWRPARASWRQGFAAA